MKRKRSYEKLCVSIDTIKTIQASLNLKTYSTVYKWVTGKACIPTDKGKALEKLFSIDRRKFCWPDEFGTPWPEVEYSRKKNDL